MTEERRILIVEDDPIIAIDFEDRLLGFGVSSVRTVGSVAQARSAIHAAIDYTKDRKAFGTPVASFQNTKFELADCTTKVLAARAFMDQCIQQAVGGTLDAATASMAKLHGTEIQVEVVDRCPRRVRQAQPLDGGAHDQLVLGVLQRLGAGAHGDAGLLQGPQVLGGHVLVVEGDHVHRGRERPQVRQVRVVADHVGGDLGR